MSDFSTATEFVCISESTHPPESQLLPTEAAIAINFNGINHAVMMATPIDLEDFATGFSLCNGIITHPHQILDVETTFVEDAVVLDVTLTTRALQQYRRVRRTMAGTSGCGLCGVEAVEQALAPLQRNVNTDSEASRKRRGWARLPPLPHLRKLRERFQQSQSSSGAMHAALFVDAQGNTSMCREDIGRHNALDKLLGACARKGIGLEDGYIAITSRCSLELVQKAVRTGVSTLVSLASPSDISVRWAQSYQLNLIHQTAREVSRVYSPGPAEAQAMIEDSAKDIP